MRGVIFIPLQVLVVFFGLSYILAAFDLGGVRTSFPRDVALQLGLTSVAFGIVTLLIVLKWYRRAVAWAWYGLGRPQIMRTNVNHGFPNFPSLF